VYRADEIEMDIQYANMDADNRRYIAEYHWERAEKFWEGGRGTIQERHYREAQKNCGNEVWESMSALNQDYAAVEEYLVETGTRFTLVPVEFVRYDENLYQELVKIDAVACRNGEPKRLSVDPHELGRYYG